MTETAKEVLQETEEYVEEFLLSNQPEKFVAALAPISSSATNAPRLTRAPVDERGKLAESLGFHAQVNHRRLRKTAARAAEYYPQWTGFRLTAWRCFLPTFYPRGSHWQSYTFDIIPVRALKAIEAAASADLFDQMQIWTPERQNTREQRRADYMKFLTDPVCVGIVEDQVFPIVRWGREELIPEWRVMLTGGRRWLRPSNRRQRMPIDRSARTARF